MLNEPIGDGALELLPPIFGASNELPRDPPVDGGPLIPKPTETEAPKGDAALLLLNDEVAEVAGEIAGLEAEFTRDPGFELVFLAIPRLPRPSEANGSFAAGGSAFGAAGGGVGADCDC